MPRPSSLAAPSAAAPHVPLAERALAAARAQARDERLRLERERRAERTRRRAFEVREHLRQERAVTALTDAPATRYEFDGEGFWLSDGCVFHVPERLFEDEPVRLPEDPAQREPTAEVYLVVSPVADVSFSPTLFRVSGSTSRKLWRVEVSGVQGIGMLLREHEVVLDGAGILALLTSNSLCTLTRSYVHPPDQRPSAGESV